MYKWLLLSKATKSKATKSKATREAISEATNSGAKQTANKYIFYKVIMPRECYICLKPYRHYNSGEMYLVDNKKYYFDCKCIVHAHKRCLNKWIGQNPTCIICRRKMTVYKTNIEIVCEKLARLGKSRTIILFCILWCIVKIIVHRRFIELD